MLAIVLGSRQLPGNPGSSAIIPSSLLVGKSVGRNRTPRGQAACQAVEVAGGRSSC